MPEAIVAYQLGKKYVRYHADRPNTLFETLIRGAGRLKPKEVFWSVRDLNFSLAAGQAMGVIGRNGAGKSTLLRLIGGVGRPDEGRVVVNGRVGAFLDLTAGLRDDLTGRENIFLSGVISGLTRRQVRQQFDAIVDFSEVGDFIDNQLRTYSTGMRLRLAFAIAAHTQPDVLLVDEVLAVGDAPFRRKCYDRIERFKAEGCAILLVSHQLRQIERLCDVALWLQNGRRQALGAPEVVIEQYAASNRAEESPGNKVAAAAHPYRFGSREVEMTGVRLLAGDGREVYAINAGDSLQVEITFVAHQTTAAPLFNVAIKREGEVYCQASTKAAGVDLPPLAGAGRIALLFERLDLKAGRYMVDVGVFSSDWAETYDFHTRMYPLQVVSERAGKGMVNAPYHWDCKHLVEK